MAWLSINLLKRNQRHIKYFVKYLEHPSFVVGQVNPGEKSGHISDEHCMLIILIVSVFHAAMMVKMLNLR